MRLLGRRGAQQAVQPQTYPQLCQERPLCYRTKGRQIGHSCAQAGEIYMGTQISAPGLVKHTDMLMLLYGVHCATKARFFRAIIHNQGAATAFVQMGRHSPQKSRGILAKFSNIPGPGPHAQGIACNQGRDVRGRGVPLAGANDRAIIHHCRPDEMLLPTVLTPADLLNGQGVKKFIHNRQSKVFRQFRQ